MKQVLIFAGTTEGRLLAQQLAEWQIPHTVCVATEYGTQMLEEHPLRRVCQGRMNQEEIREFISAGDYEAVVDATHPYAELVTRNILWAIEGMDIFYFRIKREIDTGYQEVGVRHYPSSKECVRELEETAGNILLTTGSKELHIYCASEKIKNRLFVRVLPSRESLAICEQHGLKGRQIIAMQGPFSVEMNEAIIHQYNIAHLVTKKSGRNGGYEEKLKAAERSGIRIYVTDCPGETYENESEQKTNYDCCTEKRER